MDKEKFEKWKRHQHLMESEIKRIGEKNCTLYATAPAMTAMIFNLELAFALQREMGQTTAAENLGELIVQLLDTMRKESVGIADVLFASLEEFSTEGALVRYRQFVKDVREQQRVDEKSLVKTLPRCPHCKKEFTDEPDIFPGSNPKDVRDLKGMVGICPDCAFIFYHTVDGQTVAVPQEILTNLEPIAIVLLHNRKEQIKAKILKKASSN